MKITCLTTFLDGRDRFTKDDVLTVQATETETSDERGARFVKHGWARDLSGEVTETEPAPAVTSLDIHDSVAVHTGGEV